MSRTDVHRPWRVQATDPHNRHRVRRLPANSIAFPDWEFWPLYNICACPLCSDKVGHKVRSRKVRYGKRKHIEKEIELG